MNSNEKIVRLQKFSRVVSIVLTVIQVLLVLVPVAVILAGIFWGDGLINNLNVLFSAMAQDLLTTGVMLLLGCCIVVKAGLYFVALAIARRMFQDFSREDSPFRQVHVRRMRWIALLVFIASFINVLSIQLTGWMAALLIWCVSAVFDYGCQLQRESDETL